MASMGLVRKVLRFFKSLAVLRQLRAAIPADSRSGEMHRRSMDLCVLHLRSFSRSFPCHCSLCVCNHSRRCRSLSKLDLALFLNLCAKFCLANYFLWDHFMFANKIGMWKPKDPKSVARARTQTEPERVERLTGVCSD